MHAAAIGITAAPNAVQIRCTLHSSASSLQSRLCRLDTRRRQPSASRLHPRLCRLRGCCNPLQHCCGQGCADRMHAGVFGIAVALEAVQIGCILQPSASQLRSGMCRLHSFCSHRHRCCTQGRAYCMHAAATLIAAAVKAELKAVQIGCTL